MRRLWAPLLFAALLLGVTFSALAQDSKQYVKHGTGAPSTCTVGTIYVDDSTGHHWSFKTGVGCFDETASAATAPGGTSGQIQYNNAGAFGGKSLSTLKSDLALNNADNTSDANKPVSTAQQTALDLKQNLLSNSAGLRSALSDESGTGAALFAGGNIGAATATSLAATGSVSAAVFSSTPQALTDGATVTWDLNAGQYATVTLGGNRTLSITNTATGKSGCVVVTQDGTGSRTLALPASSKVGGGGSGAVTLSTTAGAVDILCVLYVGSTPYFNLLTNYN